MEGKSHIYIAVTLRTKSYIPLFPTSCIVRAIKVCYANYIDLTNRTILYTPFLVAAGSATIAAIPIPRESSSMRLLQGMALTVRFRLAVFNPLKTKRICFM
jgi:hypothetical protein